MTNGLTETFETPIRTATMQYGCDKCRHNGTEYANKCKVHPMTTVALLLHGKSRCPFKDKNLEEIKNEIPQRK